MSWRMPYEWDLSPLYISFLISAMAAYPVYRILISLKSRQIISQYTPEHQVKQGTPTMGGIIVVIGFLTGMTSYLFNYHASHNRILLRPNFCVLALFAGYALIGFVDDFVVPRLMAGKRGLGWKQKLVLQLVVACVCFVPITGFTATTGITVFLVLAFSNAYNFSDGMDALAALLLIGLASGLLAIAFLTSAWRVIPFPLCLLGSILPFLYLNKPKAMVFMGDVGSLPIGAIFGFVFAAIAIPDLRFAFDRPPLYIDNPPVGYETMSWYVYLALVVISGMMIVELVPGPLQILSVKIRKKKLFSFTPIHHAFERKGWPELKVVLVFALAQLLLSLIAVGIVYEGVTKEPPIVFHRLGDEFKSGIHAWEYVK